MTQSRINLVNTVFIAAAHLVAVFTILYLIFFQFSWWSLGLGLLWGVCCGLAITGGYHRLFAHPTYKAKWPVKLFYLCFGAASVQNSHLSSNSTMTECLLQNLTSFLLLQ